LKKKEGKKENPKERHPRWSRHGSCFWQLFELGKFFKLRNKWRSVKGLQTRHQLKKKKANPEPVPFPTFLLSGYRFLSDSRMKRDIGDHFWFES